MIDRTINKSTNQTNQTWSVEDFFVSDNPEVRLFAMLSGNVPLRELMSGCTVAHWNRNTEDPQGRSCQNMTETRHDRPDVTSFYILEYNYLRMWTSD